MNIRFTYRAIILLVAAILFYGLILIVFIGDWEFMSSFKNPVHTKHPEVNIIAEAQHSSSLENSAYVLLALGAQANQMNCPAAVESLVRYGGWDGDVYMITDRKSCFDEDKIVKNAGMKADKFHLLEVDEDFGGGGIDFAHPKIGARKSRVRSFAMKARLFDIITDPSIQTVAYIDCDILFAIEGCAREFITAGPSWSDKKIRFSHIFTDNNNRLSNLHAGTMVAHREHSKEVLRIWRSEIEKGQSEGDNDAFMSAYERIQDEIDQQRAKVADPATAGVVANVMMPGEAVKNGDSSKQSNWFEKFVDPLKVSLHCMNHIPKARCAKYGREVVQQFVDKFALRTYEDKYPYCTHQLLQPLLYGWFPFSYLPFCPKMEQYL